MLGRAQRLPRNANQVSTAFRETLTYVVWLLGFCWLLGWLDGFLVWPLGRFVAWLLADPPVSSLQDLMHGRVVTPGPKSRASGFAVGRSDADARHARDTRHTPENNPGNPVPNRSNWLFQCGLLGILYIGNG